MRVSSLALHVAANGLSIVILACSCSSWLPSRRSASPNTTKSGVEHGERPVGLGEYLRTGHFLGGDRRKLGERVSPDGGVCAADCLALPAGLVGIQEAWRKRGSGPRSARRAARAGAGTLAGPARRVGPQALRKFAVIRFLLLFLVSFRPARHRRREAVQRRELALHGGDQIAVPEYMMTAQFWFESFQNWQSEFLSLVAMVVLSIFLRQRGSPESKPVDAPHSQTGSG